MEILVQENWEGLQVCISDHGRGFPEEVLEKLKQEEAVGSSVGLLNVHKRMKSIYGEDHGLNIVNTDQGSRVELHFKKNISRGEGE